MDAAGTALVGHHQNEKAQAMLRFPENLWM
jgi:hypothetical protein